MRFKSKNWNMPTEDKSDLFKIVKYQCKVSEGFKTLGNRHTDKMVYTYTLTPYIFKYIYVIVPVW